MKKKVELCYDNSLLLHQLPAEKRIIDDVGDRYQTYSSVRIRACKKPEKV